mmetsp:Transcript_27238/g.76081  ORF Transcript_27238/g.76081 Transcript_27238/m.76081 type:complete len:189 (+) Transcript_27238:45-611(+)
MEERENKGKQGGGRPNCILPCSCLITGWQVVASSLGLPDELGEGEASTQGPVNGEYGRLLVEEEGEEAWDTNITDEKASTDKLGAEMLEVRKDDMGSFGAVVEDETSSANVAESTPDDDASYCVGDIDRSQDYYKGQDLFGKGESESSFGDFFGGRAASEVREKKSKIIGQRLSAMWEELSGDDEEDY